MIRWAALFVVLAATLCVTGCGRGMALSSRERSTRLARIIETDARQFNDDLDLFLLNEDVSHLSPWRTRSMP